MQKSVEFNIDLNAKDRHGKTGFDYVFRNGSSKMKKMIIQKSAELNIDLPPLI